MFRLSSCVIVALLVSYQAALAEENRMPTTPLEKAVTFYASFDEAVRGDFGGGKLTPGTRTNHETEAGKFIFQPGIDDQVFRIAAREGVQGGALAPADVLPRNGRIYF